MSKSTFTRKIEMGAYLPDLSSFMGVVQCNDNAPDWPMNGYKDWMLGKPAIDLHETVKGILDGNIHASGIHRRAIVAMDTVVRRGFSELYSFTRRREYEEACGDTVCCGNDLTAYFHHNFYGYSAPMKGHPSDHREVWILGSISSGYRICGRDRLLVHSTSKDGSDGTTFVVEGSQATLSGEYLPRGLIRSGNPALVGRIDDFKLALNVEIMKQEASKA